MEKRRRRYTVEVQFVGDDDVGEHILTIDDQKKSAKARSARKQRKPQKCVLSDQSEEESDGEHSYESSKKERPTELFEAGDVPGQQMFGFQTPKSKSFLTIKPDGTPKSGRLNGTPKSGKLNSTPSRTNGTPDRITNGTPGKINVTPCRKLSGRLNGTPKLNSTPSRTNGTPDRITNGTPGKINVTPCRKLKTPLAKQLRTPHGKLSITPLSKINGTPTKKLSGSSVTATPRTKSYQVSTARTPYSLRTRLKNEISKTARQEISSESDFSLSDSEYEPTENESSSEEEGDEEEKEIVPIQVVEKVRLTPARKKRSSSQEEDEEEEKEMSSTQVSEKIRLRPRRERRPQEMKYVFDTEDYFSIQKIVTSNSTLNRLKQPRLAEDQLKQLLQNMTLSHQQVVQDLCEEHTHQFTKWMFALREQYSVVLYGLGSKRHILQKFRMMLQDQLVLEVNGFFPGLTIKEIVDSIADDLLELSNRPTGLLECLEAIEDELASEMFLIIHNLEGPMLRSDKSQDILSRLARMQHVHLIASIDHINAPLIWDHAKLSRYNFLWWDTTTFQPYSGETQFETSLLVQQSGSLALSSLSNVFHSLTTNARNIFIMMVKYQLSHHKDPTYQGMAFRDLYWSAREALLVSSDVVLRAQLTEFLDHRLVRQKRSVDGSELLQVPVEISVLQRFLEQIEGEN